MESRLITYPDGTKRWYTNFYINFKHHREDGPAVEYSNGDKEWYINGKCHREDGPAIEYSDHSKEWIIEDKYHRLNGPAFVGFDDIQWVINLSISYKPVMDNA